MVLGRNFLKTDATGKLLLKNHFLGLKSDEEVFYHDLSQNMTGKETFYSIYDVNIKYLYINCIGRHLIQ